MRVVDLGPLANGGREHRERCVTTHRAAAAEENQRVWNARAESSEALVAKPRLADAGRAGDEHRACDRFVHAFGEGRIEDGAFTIATDRRDPLTARCADRVERSFVAEHVRFSIALHIEAITE